MAIQTKEFKIRLFLASRYEKIKYFPRQSYFMFPCNDRWYNWGYTYDQISWVYTILIFEPGSYLVRNIHKLEYS